MGCSGSVNYGWSSMVGVPSPFAAAPPWGIAFSGSGLQILVVPHRVLGGLRSPAPGQPWLGCCPRLFCSARAASAAAASLPEEAAALASGPPHAALALRCSVFRSIFFLRGLKDFFEAALLVPQLHSGELTAQLPLAVWRCVFPGHPRISALRIQALISCCSCFFCPEHIRSWLMALCFGGIGIAPFVPSSAIWPRLTKPGLLA